MKKKKTQLLGIVLSAAMLATSVPAPVYAEPTDNVAEEENNGAVVAQEPTEDAAVADDATDDSTAADDATPEEADKQDTADEGADADAQAAEEGDNEVKVDGGYTISIPTINFQGANAAVAEQLTKDVEIDESDPSIQSLREALENIEIVGGEEGMEDENSDVNAIAAYSDEETETTEKKKLSEDQINTVVGMYQQYLNQWSANANVLGVQNPFFLDFNDDKDGLGILGEMLALDGATVDQVRNGEYSYDDLTGMIFTFTYGDKLGIKYYGTDVQNARKDALAAVEASGAQTKAQKLLVLNDWLAHENTFDMSYIMNSGKETEDDKPMIAKDPQPQEHEKEVNTEIYNVYEPQIKQNFHDQIFAGIEDNLRVQFYEKAIQNAVYKQALGKDESEATDEEKQAAQEQAEAYLTANKDAIDADPDGYARSNFGDDTADQLKEQADAFIKDAEENGVEVDPENAPGYKMTVEELTQQQLKSDDPALDLNNDGEKDTSFKDAIPIYAQQAADGMTTGVINYWEGSQFGAFGMGTSVCLGYSKAYTYLVQCLDKDIYLIDPEKGYDSKTTVTADDGTTSEVCDNWKTAKELYYTDGKLDTTKNYTVDLVRISFQSDVTMYGEEQEGFASDHYWNAVKVGETWYYIDPCYADVYTEVMSRDRVETDGDMNHAFFLFSETSTESLYSGNYSDIRSLYKDVATDKTYETAWMARAASNVYYADGYAYYMYDSTDLFSRTSMNQNQKSTEYKIVRHKLTSDDTQDGDSDYETLINFTDKENSDDDDTFVSVLKDGKMEKNDLLTKLYAQFVEEQSVYPSIGLTAAMYTDGKIYFNVSNDIVSYDPADGTVAVVKEYNTVSAKRDTTKLFGGMAFTTTSEDNADFTVTNHPIAGLTVKGDDLVVSIGTNFAFISGKSDILDHTSYGYEFEETDYNPTYTNYKKYQQIMGAQNNDNDEFMWSANFVDTVDLKTLTGTSHNYETVSVPATCGRDAFTEERCSDCGLIKDGTRVEKENTAHEHHYIKFHEVYYTKTDGVKNEADNYVCPECGACITEPVESKYNNSTYEKRKAIWDAAIKNEAEGHTYVPTDAKWSDDHATVTFQTLKCESCADKIDKLDCLLSSDDNAINKANRASINKTLGKAVTVDAKMVSHVGTCDKGVTAVYKAAGQTEDQTEDGKDVVKYLVSTEVKGEAGQHTYNNVEFNWDAAVIKDDDGNITGYKTEQNEGSAVTVGELKCSVCGAVEKDATVSVAKDTEASKAPTCEETGKDVYVATVTKKDADGKDVELAKDTKEVEIAKLGHAYGDPVWSDWTQAEDGTWTTTATFTCANDATHVQTPEVKITTKKTEATCEKPDTTTYTASVEFKGKTYTNSETKVVEGKALGHKYGEPVWSAWEEKDGQWTTTATFTCENDKTHVETPEVKIATEKTDATCDKADTTTYTATVEFNGKTYENPEKKTVEGKALGHKYGEPTWSEWKEAEDGTWTCTVTFTCENDKSHVETPDVTITKSSEDATCTKAGTITYAASVEFEGKTYTNSETKTVEGQALGHSWTATWNWGEKNADGNYEPTVTFSCERKDTDDVTRKADEVKVTSETVAATCEKEGKITYTATTTDPDGKEVTDTHEDVIKALGHNYGEPVWSDWEEKDGKWTTTATFACANDATDVQKPEVSIKLKTTVEPTYTTKGSGYYIAKVVSPDGTSYTNPVKKEIEIAEKKLDVVQNIKASSAVGKVTLSWDKMKDADGYLIYGKRGSDGKYGYIGMTESKTSYVDKNASADVYNFYWIYAYCKDSTGKRFVGKTPDYVYGKAKKCEPVTNLKAKKVAGGVNLSWTKSTGAEGYLIYGKYSKDGKYSYIAITNATTYTDQKAITSDYNFYWIYPYYKDSEGKRVVGKAAPYVYAKAGVFEPVTNLKATGISGGVILGWTKTKNSEVQGYLIYGKHGKDDSSTYIGMTSATTFTDTKAITSDYNFYWVYPYYKDASGKRIIGKAAPYVYGKAK